MSYGQGGYGYQPNASTYYGHETPMNYGGEQQAPPQQRTQQDWTGMNVQQTSQQFHQNATQPAYQEAPQGAVAQATKATQAVDVPAIKEIERSAAFTFCPSVRSLIRSPAAPRSSAPARAGP